MVKTRNRTLLEKVQSTKKTNYKILKYIRREHRRNLVELDEMGSAFNAKNTRTFHQENKKGIVE